jgi:WD40 repeat protein
MWPDKRTLIFEVATGQPVNTFESTFHGASQFNTLAFSADSRAVSLEDMEARCLRVVDVDTGNEQHRFALGQVYPLNAAFSPDGRWLVTGAGWQPGNRVIVWDLQTGERKLELPAVNQVAIQFDATGRRLVVGLSVYRVPEFTLEREFDGVNHMFLGALLMADGDTLLTTDDRGGILRWSLSSPAPERGAHALCGNPPNGGDWIPHESSLLLVTAEGTVVRAVPPRFVCEPVPALGSDVVSLTFVIERNQLALLHRDGSISLHDLDSRAEFARFRAKDQSVGWLFWMPETQALALRAENTLEIWDPRSQSLTWKVDLISGEDLIRPTKDGVLWQLHVDGRLFGYDVARKKVLTRQLDHNGMQRLAVSPDGRWLLTTSNEQPSPEGSKRLVDARTGKTVSQFQDADLLYPRGVAFWPHEPRAAFGAGHIVDLTTRRALLQLGEGNGLGVSPVVALGGSTLLIVGSQNRLPTYVWWAPSWEDIRWAEAVERAAGL